jgi:hypothetical protein
LVGFLLLASGFSFFHNEGETLGAKLRIVGGLCQTESVQSKGVKVEMFQTKAIELKWRSKKLTDDIEFYARQGWDTQSLFIELAKVQAELISLLGGGQADYK